MSWFTSHYKKLLLSLGFFLASGVFLPQTALACLSTTAGGGGGHVWYVNCAETRDGNGGTGQPAMPSGTQAGDIIIMTVVQDGNRTLDSGPTTTNITWTQVNTGFELSQGSANTIFIFEGRVTGTPGTTNIDLSGNTDWLSTTMRFSGSSGWESSAGEATFNTGAAETFAPAPAITTNVNESIILRIGGFDQDDFTGNTRDAVGVMPAPNAHTTISQYDTADNSVSVAHTYIYQATAGTQAIKDFATIPSVARAWRTSSMALRPFYMCDGTNAVFSVVPVQYEGCAQTGVYGNNTSLTLSSPANTGFYDYLVAVVTVDGNQDITAPGGWTQIGSNVIANGSASRMEIFGRQFSAGSPQNYNFTWGANEAAFGYIMRFTGTQGFDVAATPTTATAANPTTPGLTNTVDNSLLVRMGVFDNTPITTNPATILTGQGGRITLGRSSGDPANSVSSGAAWFDQVTAGVIGTVAFTDIAAEDSGNQTISLPPVNMCTGSGVASGAIVDYAGCVQRTANEVTSISVPTPAGTAIGDYLLAVVATDDDTSGTISAPAGWSALDVGVSNTSTATLAVYGRFADTAGAQDHNFAWTGTQNAFAYIMRYTNTFGATQVASATGSGTSVASAAITTTVANTMVVRVGAFEGATVKWHPTDINNIVTGLVANNNITQGRSTANATTAVSSAAAWANQAGIGTSGTPTFNGAPTTSVPTRRVTVGLRPNPTHFRISHNGVASLCGQPTITITVYNPNGTINTGYTGTVQLSTSTVQGYWGIGDGLGTLSGGVSGNGTASYTFVGDDLGSVSFQYAPVATGAVNFNLIEGSTIEHPAFDASLLITHCLGVPLQQQCANALTTPTITIPSNTTPSSNRLVLVATHRSGAVGSGGAPAGTATFNGAAMTQVGTTSWIDSGNDDAMTQIFMMSQSTAPALPAGGTYSATMAGSTGGFERICVFYYEDVAQTVPAGGAVANTPNTTPGTTVSNNITPPANNSLVLSVVSGTIQNGSFPVATAPMNNRLQNVSGTASTFAVSSGVLNPPAVAIVETSLASIDRRAHSVAAFAPVTSQLDHFRISHAGTGDNCTPNDITITAMDQYGNVFTSYTGTVNLTAEGVGDWTETTANGTLQNLTADDGIATYAFTSGVGQDNGVVTLHYTDYTADSSKDFNVTDSVTPAIDEHDFFDPKLNMVQCQFRVTLPSSSGSICQSSAVTIGLYDPNGNLAVDYEGQVTILASLFPGPGANGDWTAGAGLGDPALGVFNHGAGNDGSTLYTFHTNDNGLITLGYDKVSSGDVKFSVSGGGMGGVNGSFNPTLTVGNCYFRIDHDDDGDSNGEVCMREAVKITVVNASGVIQDRTTSQVYLVTSTAKGDWFTEGAVLGTFVNEGLGKVKYTFHDDDNGEKTLYLMHHETSGGVQFAAVSGIAIDPNPIYNPAMVVAGCKIRFSLSSPNATACTPATLTVGIYNGANVLAEQYAGDVTLTTSTNHGSWLSDDAGPGTVADGSPGNGTGTYTFAVGDQGDAQIVFSSTDIESLNFNATANNGSITVSTTLGHDPNLNVTACLPVITSDACYANSGPGAITLGSSVDSGGSRMVLVYVGSSSTTNAGSVTMTGASQALTLLDTATVATGPGTKLQVFGIRDVHLPSAAGSYNVTVNTPAAGTAICIVALTGVGQTLPVVGAPPEDGPINKAVLENDTPINTEVTTPHNNSIIIGVTLNDGPLTLPATSNYLSSLTNELWATNVADPTNADWAGHSAYQLPIASVIVTDTADVVPARQAQIVLSLAPFITSAQPASAGFEPVALFKTFSGNVNYRAIGNTLRVAPNLTGAECVLYDEATGSQATMVLPPGATIKNAYLYWSGSGYLEAHQDDDVMFGPVGNQVPVTASEVFVIDPNQVYNPAYDPVPEGFFAAFKEVTGEVVATTPTTYHFSGLTVQNGPPWSDYLTCLGGWALVIVYEDAEEPLNVINLFHGFQPFWHSSFTLIPRNFRMATPPIPPALGINPHAQVTHITFEGDEDIVGAAEVLEIQNNPNAMTFSLLTNAFNPNNNQYNGTESFPNYTEQMEGGVLLNVFNGTYDSTDQSFGTDVDTYYVQGDTAGEPLHPFGTLESEQITTRYSTDQDIVLLVGEFISVTNAPIADLEVSVTPSGTFKVGGTGTYTFDVWNNGNGAVTGGYASGDVILTGELQAGVTINTLTPNGWDCPLDKRTATRFTCIFEINGDWTIGIGAVVNGQLLKKGVSAPTLPDVVVTVNVADELTFPNIDNDVQVVARIASVGDYYSNTPYPCIGQGAAAGIQPNPNPATGCLKPPEFDNVNDLNKYLIDIDNLDEKSTTNNNVHGVTHNIRGIETKLSISKTLSGILQVDEPAVYNITVTNAGPDVTTKTITVEDELPAGLVPVSAAGTGWTCDPIAGQDVLCTYAPGLGIGATTLPLTITTANIVAPAVEGATINNEATVSIAAGNHDTDGGNSSTDSHVVNAALAAATEKFLVSIQHNNTTIGGVLANNGDLVLYDPVTQTATMFLDEDDIPDTGALTNLGNIDAVHVMANGWIALSTATADARINGVDFKDEDIVLYDPVLKTAVLLFDGSAIFDGTDIDGENSEDIDAIFIKENGSATFSDWDILISTASVATTTADSVTFQNNDIVSYNMGTGGFGAGGTATVLVDGADADMFGANNVGNISGIYVRYDDADKYIVSTSAAGGAIIGTSVPLQTLEYDRGEIVEIDLSTPGAPVTTPMLCNDDGDDDCLSDDPIVISHGSSDPFINAFHVVETAYFGHFEIDSVGGNECTATTITITKHAGLTHNAQTGYGGSIRISVDPATGSPMGTWAKDASANGLLTVTGPGEAIYTFVPGAGPSGDAGEVTLYITGTGVNTLDVNVTNGPSITTGFTVENPGEDPDIAITVLASEFYYKDFFTTAAYTNNDGDVTFAGPWIEANDDGNATTGKIRIDTGSGRLRMYNFGGGTGPSLTREVNFTTYGQTIPPVFSFDYTVTGTPAGGIAVEVSNDNGSNWTLLDTITAGAGSATATYSFSGAPWNVTPTADTQFRLRVASGYTSSTGDVFYVDNLQVKTETHDCGVGANIDHYAITHTGTVVSCLAQPVTITPHTVGELAIEPAAGTVITLNATSGGFGKGYWGPPTNGTLANFHRTVDGDNGQATYEYAEGEDDLTFPYYFPDMAGASATVTFSVSDSSVPIKYNRLAETQELTVSRTGLRFIDEQIGSYPTYSTDFPTLVAGMRSDTATYSDSVLVVQAIETSTEDPTMCVDLFVDETVHEIELAFECINPATCSSAVLPVSVLNNAGTPVAIEPISDNGGGAGVSTPGAYTAVPLEFVNNNLGSGGGRPTTYTRAELILNSADVGQFQIHGRYNIQVQDQTNTTIDSTGYMSGSGDTFVVRPFAFDIDFPVDPDGAGGDAEYFDRREQGNVEGAMSWAEDADDTNDQDPAEEPTFFARAGVGFNTTVRAVAWQSADDSNGDGVPDDDAYLADNPTTENFGNEDGTQYNVKITHVRTPNIIADGDREDELVEGTLTSTTFLEFGPVGTSSQSMTYNEVGIIDLTATLRLNGGPDTPYNDYLGGGQGVSSKALNVGRFIPAGFTLTPTMTARPLFTPQAADFTYMGEEFHVTLALTAHSACGVQPCPATVNYIDSFAKLTDFDQLSFHAIDDVGGGNDVAYTDRLFKTGVSDLFQDNYGGSWTAGQVTLDGNLVFNRQTSLAPEAPFTDLRIAVTVEDTDGVVEVGRDVDDDDGTNEDMNFLYRLIGEHEFRYGRLRLENGYGSDVPDMYDHDDNEGTADIARGRDVMVSLVAEYFDGTDFVPNTLDVATPYDSDNLSFVAGSFTDNLAVNEAAITDAAGVVYEGVTREDATASEIPLFLRAPLSTGNDGSALIELDLDALGLSFLKFAWRDDTVPGDDPYADVKADPDDYTGPDNPRAIVEFGQFRGNDRIINWQEIFE